jgi:hypothetical protein
MQRSSNIFRKISSYWAQTVNYLKLTFGYQTVSALAGCWNVKIYNWLPMTLPLPLGDVPIGDEAHK